MSVAFVFSKNQITVMLDRPVTISEQDVRYPYILKALKDKEPKERFQQIIDGVKNPQYIEEVKESGTNLEVKGEEVYINGEKVHNSIAKRIKQFIDLDLPFDNMLRFVENVRENPSYQSQQELYDFLEYLDLPITEDGHFLAYKSVNQNYKDWQTHSFDNSPGQRLSMPRGNVDDDRRKGCSFGFHVGSIDYVKGFNPGGKRVIVKVNPKDVVSVPHENSCQKCRVCEYEVLMEFEEVFDKPLYTSDARPVTSNIQKVGSISWNEIAKNYNLDEEQRASYGAWETNSDLEEDDEYEYNDDEEYDEDDYDNYYDDDFVEDDDFDKEDEDEDEDDYPMPQSIL